uniref:RNase H type-1 domain-containing protein n=1 Tax=Arundo donax TaxID=35708 RepID=A0A0A9G2M2_ARUDO
MRRCILLLLWRAWHLRNDIIHAKGECTITGSTIFLKSYRDSLFNIRQQGSKAMTDEKGKRKINDVATSRRDATINDQGQSTVQARWEPPPEGWCKANVDAAFHELSGEAGIGIIIRDHKGCVQLSA